MKDHLTTHACCPCTIQNPSSHNQKSGFADCSTLYKLQREVSYLQQKMEWYVFTYMDHLKPFLFLGGRPTAQLFISYEKSNLSNKHIVQYIKKRWLEKCYFMLCIYCPHSQSQPNLTLISIIIIIIKSIWLWKRWNNEQTQKTDGQFDLLNQSPELYESRSNDLDRNMSSPAWKNGMPWYVTQ
jgi:hypothetical protein